MYYFRKAYTAATVWKIKRFKTYELIIIFEHTATYSYNMLNIYVHVMCVYIYACHNLYREI